MRNVILGLLAAACVHAQPMTPAGHYYLQRFPEVGSELLLRPNGTFEFALTYGAGDWWAKGTWRVQDGAVILNSNPRKDNAPFRLLRSSATKAAGIRIRVVGLNASGVPNIDVALLTGKGKVEARTDPDGIAVFSRESPAKSVVFSVRVYQLETEPLALDSAHDDFTFEINGEVITELRFSDERMMIKGNTLVSHYWGPDTEMRYVKAE